MLTKPGRIPPQAERTPDRLPEPGTAMSRVEKAFVNSEAHSRRVAARAERLVRLAAPKPGQRLLDFGCGNGAAAARLAAELRLDVTGVDVDPGQIAAARLRGRDIGRTRFLVVEGGRLPFQPDEFDIVFTNKVTHHIPDWDRALAELVRVLKPGGYLVYSDLVAPFGARFPTRRALDRLFAEHRLEVVHRSSSPVQYTGVLRVCAPESA